MPIIAAKPLPKPLIGVPLDNRPRCEYTIHCECPDEENSVCSFNGNFDRDFHEAFCMTDPNRPIAVYCLTYDCPECGHNWEEFLCEDCVIEGPDNWGYWNGKTGCPMCKKECIPLPNIVRL